MKYIQSYLNHLNKQLTNQYKIGNDTQSCTIIAMDIAKKLIEQNQSPSIIQIYNPIHNQYLTPIKYNTSWGKHITCLCNNLIYDPLYPTPKPIDEYLKYTFKEDNLQHKIVFSTEEIKNILNNNQF